MDLQARRDLALRLGRGATVHLIGIEFSRTARNVVGFEIETLQG